MAMIRRGHQLTFVIPRWLSSAIAGVEKEGVPLSQIPLDERPTKVMYKEKIYYLKPRPGKTNLQEEFTLEDIDKFQKGGFIDIYGQPAYRSLRSLFVHDPEYEMTRHRAWQYCAQLNEGVKPVYRLGNKDLAMWNIAKLLMIVNLFILFHNMFHAVVPSSDNPFVWHGDENKYMGLKDWFLGRKMKTTSPQ